MKKATIRKNKFKSKALVRSTSITVGVSKILQLLERAEVNEVSSVVDSPLARDILMMKVA